MSDQRVAGKMLCTIASFSGSTPMLVARCPTAYLSHRRHVLSNEQIRRVAADAAKALMKGIYYERS
jgi:hypothetical protein